MARGAAAKLRRRQLRKEMGEDEDHAAAVSSNDFAAPVEPDDSDDGDEVPPIPLPPGMAQQVAKEKEAAAAAAAGGKSSKSKKKAAAAAAAAGGKKEGIKTMPLILLLLMTGTTVLPALIYASDFLGSFLQSSHLMGNVGYRLGIGATPKKRVLSFYEKHDPTKVPKVDKIMADHYGDYPKLIKKLERKYQDYGYFINWEKDEAPMTLALEKLEETRDFLLQKWTQYAPLFLRERMRNVKYNLTYLYKRGYKFWKKKIWPLLEPIFGVPDGAAQQKRKDAREAREARASGGGTKRRKKNAEYRDDEEM